MNDYINEYLEAINPSALDYEDWLKVGMALHHEGYSLSDWEQWSSADSRYTPAEMPIKWRSFSENNNAVTGGTIYSIAVENGFKPTEKKANFKTFDADTIFNMSDLKVVDKSWMQKQEVPEPRVYDDEARKAQATKYIESLFKPEEYVGISNSYLHEESGNHFPGKGEHKLCSELVDQINNFGVDLAFGTSSKDRWIRCNPMDGSNVSRDENITDYRYALVESDDMAIGEQYSMLKELELPIATLTHSGGKSLHALVKINARSKYEYKERVDQLIEVCEKNGFSIDKKNRNPSRLTRLAGCFREGEKQFLIDTHIGKTDFVEWFDWVKELNDDLPDIESFDCDTEIEKLNDELINGVLRKGHKMMLTGPSKAGKSFGLIQLAISIALGIEWLGSFQCAKGRVLYMNMEIDKKSCKNRVNDIHKQLKEVPNGLLDIWNLRGENTSITNLIPKLIRRAKDKGYSAIIMDPLYKMLEGDESDAAAMTKFGMLLDKCCKELDCALIYCHHHSKGGQGDKVAHERASGSGVLSRDPDAILDLTELEYNKFDLNNTPTDDINIYVDHMLNIKDDYLTDDMRLSFYQMRQYVKKSCGGDQELELLRIQSQKMHKLNERTAWRISATLREFKGFDNVNVWFDYPIHSADESEMLKSAEIKGSIPASKFKKIKPIEETKKREPRTKAFKAFKLNLKKNIALGIFGVDTLIEASGAKVDFNTKTEFENHVEASNDYLIKDGNVIKKVLF